MRRRLGTHHEQGVIGRDIDPDSPPAPRAARPEKGWEQRYHAREEQQAQVMALFAQMTAHLGGLLTLAQAPPKNDVLAQMAQFIPANGVLQRGWKQNFQSVTVTNFGSTPLTVTSQGMQSQAPSVGSGVAVVPAGIERTLQLRGNSVSIYGTPGSLVELVAYARPRPPQSSICSSAPEPPVTFAVGNPAAGAQFSANPSPNAPFSIAGVAYTLTTSATVANRVAGVLIAGLASFNSFNQTATQAFPYSFFPGAPQGTGVAPISAGPYPAGTLVASDITAMQAGDQISAISLLISPEAVA